VDVLEVKRRAEAELEQEQFRAAVDAMKERLKTERSLWDRIFPWRITITRKDAQ
jgi:ribosomal protein L16/L10AE